MSEENVTPKAKRHYVKRQAEFYDMDIPTLLVLKDDLNNKLKAINKSLKESPNSESATQLKFEQKEIVNKRIRIYARLRKLGYDAMSVRRSKAAEKKIGTPETEHQDIKTAVPEPSEDFFDTKTAVPEPPEDFDTFTATPEPKAE